MTSVVIAAHNEEAVIGRCLESLLAGTRPDELDVTVVANGCSDATAAVASRYPGVRVLSIEVASKPAALNAGDEVAIGFPRIYLDADIVAPVGGAQALAAAVETGATGTLAAVPRRDLDLAGRPWLVRGYFAINSRLPVFRNGLFGRGMIAISAQGRARFGRFPDMVADDLFLDSLFGADEKLQVDTLATRVATPFRTRDLLRRLVRVRRGNTAMREAGRAGRVEAAVRPADRLAWLRDVVLPNPRLVPAALAYVGITATAAILARNPRSGSGWGRDESSRTGPASSTDPEPGVPRG